MAVSEEINNTHKGNKQQRKQRDRTIGLKLYKKRLRYQLIKKKAMAKMTLNGRIKHMALD